MMLESTTGDHLSFLAVLLLMSLMATTADAVSVFRKSPTIELGNVYDSSNSVLTSLVVSNGHCGLICDELGDDQCQSFSVKPEGNQIRCELFDHQPRKVASIVPHPTGQLFEEECEALRVTASAKAMKKDLEIVLLIDDNRGVYRLTSASPKPRLIGSLEEVFVGFNQRLDSLLFFERIPPFGDIFLIRHETLMFCYKAVDKDHDKFTTCDKNIFPVRWNQVFPLGIKEGDYMRLIVNGNNIYVAVFNRGVVKSTYMINEKSSSIKDMFRYFGDEYYHCEGVKNFEFCSLYQPFWFSASSGIHLNGEYFGLFIGTKMYTFDFGKKIIEERYPVCKNKNLVFFFEERP